MIFLKVMVFLGLIKCGRSMLCNEDAHCSEGLFCDLLTHTCRKCYTCFELNRFPTKFNSNTCIKTGEECGPCFESFVKYFNWSSKCVPQIKEDRRYLIEIFLSSHGYFWLIWIFVACVICAIFIQVLLSTNIVKVVGYYVPKSSMMQQNGFLVQNKYIFFIATNETDEFPV